MQKEARPWQVRQTTLEIELSLLRKNYYKLLERAKGAELLVLLKSDAYGHSHREVAASLEKLPEKAKLHGYGVANVEEGIELRREGVRRPIYILSGIQDYDEDLHRCLEVCNLTPVVSSIYCLERMSAVLRKIGESRTLHLKFNTGMNRLGIEAEEVEHCLRILANPALRVEGVSSHFSSSDRPQAKITKSQIRDFREIMKRFVAQGKQPRYVHMANSMALANGCFPEGNLARVGLHLYGLADPTLDPIARWTAQVYQVRELKKGETVGYGPHFRAKKRMKMAVLGVGYGDGYRRLFSNRAEVLLKGKRCPVIGAVSMDMTMVDVSRVGELGPNDRAILLGRDGREEITANELAGHAKSIAWEILTGISARVPRVFSDARK